jgi:hypothetical protein
LIREVASSPRKLRVRVIREDDEFECHEVDIETFVIEGHDEENGNGNGNGRYHANWDLHPSLSCESSRKHMSCAVVPENSMTLRSGRHGIQQSSSYSVVQEFFSLSCGVWVLG